MIQEGYLIPFISPPPLTGVPIDISSRHPAMSEVISSLLKKNAIESVLNPNFRGFYSRLFLVPKKDGKWRPVIDLSALNLLIPVDKFKMESTRSIRVAIRKGDWAVSLDLTHAFLSHPDRFLLGEIPSVCDRGRSAPISGLFPSASSPPLECLRRYQGMGAFLRMKGPQLLQYFDDWLPHRTDRVLLFHDLSLAWRTILRLGLIPNTQKSELIPSKRFTFVGMTFFTDLAVIRVPSDRVYSLIQNRQLYSTHSAVNVQNSQRNNNNYSPSS